MLIWLLLGGGAFVLLVIAVFAVILTIGDSERGDLSFGDRVQVVDIQGELVDSRPVVEQLQRYENSNSVPAILLNIDSPGGGVAVSRDLFSDKRFANATQGRGRYMSSVGASGAYYAAWRGQDHCESRASLSIGVIEVGELRRPAAVGKIKGSRSNRRDEGCRISHSVLTDREKVSFNPHR